MDIQSKSLPEQYMYTLRHNIQLYMGFKNYSIHQLAENAGISYETLKSIIYGNAKNCHISTVIALAKSFGISVDELMGAGTISPEDTESIQIIRTLPKSYVKFVRWAIKYYSRMLEEKRVSVKSVNVMLPDLTNEGNIQLTNNFELAEISSVSDIIRPKVFMGIRLPGENYMPKYSEGSILLIANDRNPMPSEVSVIVIGGFIWLARRMVENGIPGMNDEDGRSEKCVNFYSIRDGKFRVNENDIDEYIGYVAGVLRD